MLTEWRKLRLLRGMIALIVASVGASPIARFALFASERYFAQYPPDEQDAMGKAFLTLGLSWIVLFVLTMYLLGWWIRRPDQKELAE